MTDPTITDLFCFLDKWRHFPAYRLEPRSDPFFSLFLSEVLEAYLQKCHPGIEIDPRIIPEFPLKKATNNQSTRVDYFALSKDRKQGFLIELKTDMGSLKDGQCKRLQDAAENDMDQILSDLLVIASSDSVAKKKPTREKYFHLLRAVADLELFEQDQLTRLREIVYGAGSAKEYKACIEGIRSTCSPPDLEVIYILPCKKEGKNCVDFEYFADHIQNRGEIGALFANYLRRWDEQGAGSQVPRENCG